jgi:uncharacterized protein YjbJ (UPF0337 family)
VNHFIKGVGVIRSLPLIRVLLDISKYEDKIMNKDIASGKWTQFKGKLRESWGDLTDDEVEQTKGNAQQLAGLLQERYGLAKDQAEKEIEALTK